MLGGASDVEHSTATCFNEEEKAAKVTDDLAVANKAPRVQIARSITARGLVLA